MCRCISADLCAPSSPGRHYVSILLKTILMHVLESYDLQLENHDAPRTFSWRSTVIPRPSTTLLVRRRAM